MNRPADRPAVHVAKSAWRPGLVELAIGGGIAIPYSVAPEFAMELASQLTATAEAARAART